MFNRLNKIVNKIRALSGDKWSDKNVVNKILTAYMAIDINLPTLIREKRGFKRFTPADVIGRIEQHLTTMKEAKISQELSRIHKQMEKNNGVALKSSLKKKAKTKVESTSSKKKESDSDSDDDIALIIKRFKKVMKKDGYSTTTRVDPRSQGGQTSHALGVGKLAISLPIAPTQRTRTRVRRRSKAKARRGTRVKLILVWSGTQVKNYPPMMKVRQPWSRKLTSPSHRSLEISPMMKMTSLPLASWQKGQR
jgi:hypothetical protein